MAREGLLCSISARIYPGGSADSPVQATVAFRHKSIDGDCMALCPFYQEGSCQIYDWMSSIDPMILAPVEENESDSST